MAWKVGWKRHTRLLCDNATGLSMHLWRQRYVIADGEWTILKEITRQ